MTNPLNHLWMSLIFQSVHTSMIWQTQKIFSGESQYFNVAFHRWYEKLVESSLATIDISTFWTRCLTSSCYIEGDDFWWSGPLINWQPWSMSKLWQNFSDVFCGWIVKLLATTLWKIGPNLSMIKFSLEKSKLSIFIG